MTRKMTMRTGIEPAEKRLGGEEPLVGRPGEEPGVAGDGGIARELEPGQQ